MKEIERYIIEFLAGAYADFVRYGEEDGGGRVVIVRDNRLYDNYGKAESMPCLPLKEFRGVPVLYGESRMEERGGTIYVYADFVSSAYFLLSGYEEMIFEDVRDGWGRFPGKRSLAFLGGFIDRPVVDEYRILLLNILREAGVDVPDTEEKISRVYLTHDVDQPWQQYNLKQAVKRSLYKLLKRREFDAKPLKNWMGIYDEGYLEPFCFFLEEDGKVRDLYGDGCECIYFLLANAKKQPLTYTYIDNPRILTVLDLLKNNGCTVGLHGSPDSNKDIAVLKTEKDRLERRAERPVFALRNHCLLVRGPSGMEKLSGAGIRKEFSRGYADVAGFRLGTSRAVRYINPYDRKLCDLLLQPLIVMDGTLDDGRYMNLTFEQAFSHVEKLICAVKKTNGELTLLWHNHICADTAETYHRRLYKRVMEKLLEVYQ